jgi:hypothetical protein
LKASVRQVSDNDSHLNITHIVYHTVLSFEAQLGGRNADQSRKQSFGARVTGPNRKRMRQRLKQRCN